MTDEEIIELYWARKEQAIGETACKYGGYCTSIAQNILRDRSDSEECVNDTWLHTWTSIPPKRPRIFPSYLGTITRNLSLTRCRNSNAQKRRGQKLSLAYEELEECVPDAQTVETMVDSKNLAKALNHFLFSLPPKDCCIMVRRYWYLDSIGQIARRYGMSEGAVKSKLCRLRAKLKGYLEQEGFGV